MEVWGASAVHCSPWTDQPSREASGRRLVTPPSIGWITNKFFPPSNSFSRVLYVWSQFKGGGKITNLYELNHIKPLIRIETPNFHQMVE